MEGVATLLEDDHAAAIEALYAELHAEFGLRRLFTPHFSYHVAERYDAVRLRTILSSLAENLAPLTVQAAGLGLFMAPDPVLYVTVVRTPALTRLHQAIYGAVSVAAEGLIDYYKPVNWVPHVTLAHLSDLAAVGPILSYIQGRTFDWPLPVDHLAYLPAVTKDAEPYFRLSLSG